MTTEKMTIHKALCELKTLDARITKCTFYGVTSDFEPADDNEMSKFLGF